MTALVVLSLAALACLISGVVLFFKQRSKSRADAGREGLALRKAMESHQVDVAAQLTLLSQNLESLEASMQSSAEVLRDGRLNLSARARALQLLRAGISPDTAAVTLGVASREIRLLAKISRLLAIN